jgi:hypothetical protein
MMPDVIVSLRGLRCAIEGRIDSAPDTRKELAEKARQRVDSGIAHMAVAVLYPPHLRTVEFAKTADALRNEKLDFSILTESAEEAWRCGSLDALLVDLRRSYRRLADDDVVARSVDLIRSGMEDVVNVLMSEATSLRLAELLGVYEEKG